MFKSIVYIDGAYDSHNSLYLYQYKIIDSDFVGITTIKVSRCAPMFATCDPIRSVAAIIKEYQNINCSHEELIINLFLINIFILQRNWYDNMNEILSCEYSYLNKEYYHEIDFRKYYNDLVKYTKKIMVLV